MKGGILRINVLTVSIFSDFRLLYRWKTSTMSKNNRLTLYIFIAMLIGVGVGYYVYANYPKATAVSFADNVKLLTTIFLRLVQMIIAPVVFSTLVVGIAKLGDLKTVGRV